VRAGEQLIATVYKAIRGNPNLWPNTAILVVYDDHGGIYSRRAETPAESMIVNLFKARSRSINWLLVGSHVREVGIEDKCREDECWPERLNVYEARYSSEWT
jgi:hypothetical protein